MSLGATVQDGMIPPDLSRFRRRFHTCISGYVADMSQPFPAPCGQRFRPYVLWTGYHRLPNGPCGRIYQKTAHFGALKGLVFPETRPFVGLKWVGFPKLAHIGALNGSVFKNSPTRGRKMGKFPETRPFMGLKWALFSPYPRKPTHIGAKSGLVF